MHKLCEESDTSWGDSKCISTSSNDLKAMQQPMNTDRKADTNAKMGCFPQEGETFPGIPFN